VSSHLRADVDPGELPGDERGVGHRDRTKQ
jgi:hypothetical protein